MSIHIPVLLNESIEFLISNNKGTYFDGTAGFGGHSSEILKRLTKKGRLIATDKDIQAFDFCTDRFKDDARYTVYNTSFISIETISKIEFIDNYDGILADLGVSSFQLDDSDSGFTFREDSPLDLRMNKKEGITAAEFLNNSSYDEIVKVLFGFGEEKNSRQITKKIIEAREIKKFETSFQLKKIIEEITPSRFVNKTSARVFQAIRIKINNELDELEDFLNKSVDLLKTGGRIAVITFHSLEDRIVKEKFKYEAAECVCPPGMPICTCGKIKRLKILTPKPVVASAAELQNNRRARSAKLRVAERV